jgi:UDP-N-acetyl-2-amino-2-deoxyglucuronate dehydrogenase
MWVKFTACMISEKEQISFALIGAGHIGQRHMEMIMRHQEAKLVAACDVLAADQVKIPEGVAYYNEVEVMLRENPLCQVVSVCSPNGLHATHALEALDHLKHVVIEKPMALHKTDCESIVHKALQVNRQVFCVMQNRYSPPSIWVKDVIQRDLLGKIFMVDINCYWNRDDRYYTGHNWKGTSDLDGGTLFTQFSHFIDIMYWLFGDISNIQARFRDFNHGQSTAFEDSGIVQFDFLRGGSGSINFSTSVWNTNFESSLTIIGEYGTVKLGGQYMNEVKYCHIRDYEMPELAASNPANDYGHYKGSAANHGFIIANVVDTLKGRTNITTNALEGMKVVEIIERIYASASRPEKK